MSFRVLFEPWGVGVDCAAGATILDAARLAEVPVAALCGGRGTCRKCAVRVVAEPAPPPLPVELEALGPAAVREGFRLACLHVADRDMTVETLAVVARGKEAAPPLQRPFTPASGVWHESVTVVPPALADPVDDAGRLLRALAAAGGAVPARIDYQVARGLSALLREGDGRVRASVRAGELINVRPAWARGPDAAPREPVSLGLAVDLGTTNIAAYLYDLEKGDLLGVYGIASPLAAYGADIIARLTHKARSPEAGRRMQGALIRALNLLLERIAAQRGCDPEEVEEVVAVGNSGMHHIFLDLPARQLVVAPYVPALRRQLSIKARDIGLRIAPGGYVYMPPLVGGFIGSDLLAVALSARPDQRAGVHLAMDIGTNTELLLCVAGRMWSCSTASGPALEGAALRFGCMAAEGAVDKVWPRDAGEPFGYHTIGDRPAVGICGSGIIDALAAMWRSGVMDASGRLQAGHALVREDAADGERRMLLVPAAETDLGLDITISQTDVRAIQLAKGAIRAGMGTLLQQHGLRAAEIDTILIAGAFGNRIDIESGLTIGLLPPVPPERIRQIGNAAGLGAGLMLLSEAERRDAEALSERIAYVELAADPSFTRLFARAQHFPR